MSSSSLPSVNGTIPPQNYVRFIGTNGTISNFQYRAAQIILLTFAVAGTVGTIYLIATRKAHHIPFLLSFCVYGGTALSAVLLGGSFFVFKDVESASSSSAPSPETRLLQHNSPPAGHTLYVNTNLSKYLNNLHHELCEMNEEGDNLPCSYDRLQEIISLLKKDGEIKLLNAIPAYYSKNPLQPRFSKISSPFFTPLHYWASRGHSEAVTLLLENGAHDYFTEGENFYKLSSGVYQAALYGHPAIVRNLLQHGSRVNVSFNNNNILFSFIPKLVFEISELFDDISLNEDKINSTIESLEILLNYLHSYHKQTLDIQLQIPIKERLNSLGWIEDKILNQKNELIKQRLNRLKEKLASYGITKEQIFTSDYLKSQNHNLGDGFTIYRKSLLKSN